MGWLGQWALSVFPARYDVVLKSLWLITHKNLSCSVSGLEWIWIVIVTYAHGEQCYHSMTRHHKSFPVFSNDSLDSSMILIFRSHSRRNDFIAEVQCHSKQLRRWLVHISTTDVNKILTIRFICSQLSLQNLKVLLQCRGLLRLIR